MSGRVPTRRAKVRLTGEHLCQMLDLPEGLRVIGMAPCFDPTAFDLIVEGDDLDPVPDDTESPFMAGSLASAAILHDGRYYRRHIWRPSQAS